MELEVAILNNRKYQERHMIADVLSRTGQKHSVIFYGGAGGGSRSKPTQIIPGNILRVVFSNRKKSSMYSCSEWTSHWKHLEIQNDYKAYYLLHFFLEVIGKTTVESDEEHVENSLYYKLLSNMVYYLEDSVVKKGFKRNQHLILFIGKILYYSGVLPGHSHCMQCSLDLDALRYIFSESEGGFICENCWEASSQSLYSKGKSIRDLLNDGITTSYKDYQDIFEHSDTIIKDIYSFFFSSTELKPSHLKSYNFVF